MFEVNRNEENNKRRKRESKVWEEMTKSKGNDGQVWARCIHCQRDVNGASKYGTTHLKNHLEICRKKRKGGEDVQKSVRTNDLTSTRIMKETSVMDLIKNCFDEEGSPTEHWNPSVLNSRKDAILQIYQEEKEKLCKFFSQLSCRISLRIEGFGSWYFLTAHYIDENWEWNSKFISFLNGNCGCRSFIEALKELCLDLKINGNIFSIVNDYNVDDVIGEITTGFTQQGSLPFGVFLELYRDVLEDINERINPDFTSINLTREQLGEATAAIEFHKSIDNILSLFESNYPIPNMYFSKFCDLYMKLLQAERSVGHLHGKNNSSRQMEILAVVKQKFIDKYWSQYKLVLAITVILDPRFKMEIVQLWYNMIYGCDANHYLKEIIDDFQHVYNEYAKGLETSSISYLDAKGRPCSSAHKVIPPKSEFDLYLKEPKFRSVENFDILTWWRLYSPIYPTLARMARDFLAIPIVYLDMPGCWYDIIARVTDAEIDANLKTGFLFLVSTNIVGTK